MDFDEVVGERIESRCSRLRSLRIDLCELTIDFILVQHKLRAVVH